MSPEQITQGEELLKKAYPLNSPQEETLVKMLKLLSQCSRADLVIRINGREEVLEADFLRYHLPLYVFLQNNASALLSAASWALERGYADSESMECQTCHKRSLDVSCRPDAYANDVGNNPDAMHTVCDSCDHENRMDI